MEIVKTWKSVLMGIAKISESNKYSRKMLLILNISCGGGDGVSDLEYFVNRIILLPYY